MPPMTPAEYIKAVLVTESASFDKIKDRLQNEHTIRLLHAAMGICTEAGEFMDAIKKAIFYGKDIDLVNLTEELGDLFWYAALALDEIGIPMETCFERNIAKLQQRYRGKFGETAAENRDLVAERAVLDSLLKEPELGILNGKSFIPNFEVTLPELPHSLLDELERKSGETFERTQAGLYAAFTTAVMGYVKP